MAAFALKPYQQQALDALQAYLRAARLQGARSAFTSETGYGYQSQPFGEVPCVCLRIPTGGGKTLLAAHAVGLMAHEWPSGGWSAAAGAPKPFAQGIPLEQLARHQHTLVQKLGERIAVLRDQASHGAFRQLVLEGGWSVEASSEHAFRFDPQVYPVAENKRYDGKFRFRKHYYPVLANLKDGGEEWHCALAIDQHARVRHWVRNLDSDPVAGFWLPTSFGRFYPDFIGELVDGRLFVIEYKGTQIRDMAKEIEKQQVGALWAQRSGGRCCFGFVYKLEAGKSVLQQVDAVLA